MDKIKSDITNRRDNCIKATLPEKLSQKIHKISKYE